MRFQHWRAIARVRRAQRDVAGGKLEVEEVGARGIRDSNVLA